MADPDRHPIRGPDGAGDGSWADLGRLCATAETALQAGNLDEAEALYAVVLARDPGHRAASAGAARMLHRRVLELERRGRLEAALKLIREARAIEGGEGPDIEVTLQRLLADRAREMAPLPSQEPTAPDARGDGSAEAEAHAAEPSEPRVVALAPPADLRSAVEETPARPGAVFEARRSGLPPVRAYLVEVWRRRQFVVHMARAKLKGDNAATFAGRFWTLLNPILLALTYFLLVAVILQAQADSTAYLGSLLAGLFAYFYTANSLRIGSSSVVGAGNLVMNTAFPRLLLPLSACMSAFLLFLPMLAVYAVFHLVAGFPLGAQLLALPLIVVLQTGLTAGLAMLVAVANVFVRDVGRALPYALRIWLYLSPVLWTVEQVPDSAARIVQFNPLYPLFANWHAVLIDGDWPDLSLLVQSGGWALVALVAGATLFMFKERDFAIRL